MRLRTVELGRPDSVTQAFERACRRAGIEGVHFHDLRHKATSRLAERLQAHELAEVTGHRDMHMVLRYYHPRAEDLAQRGRVRPVRPFDLLTSQKYRRHLDA